VPRPADEEEVVVGVLRRIADHHPSRQIGVADLFLHDPAVACVRQDAADGRRGLGRTQSGGRDLIKQGLKKRW